MPDKRHLLLLALAGALFLAQGCSSVNSAMGGNTQKEAKAEVSWDFARDAIQIELASDDNLNAYFDQPHTLVMGVFQLEDAKAFTKLLGDAGQLKTILATGDAGQDVIQLDRYVVSPGKHTILDIDRVQDAKFVGIVAGYYHFDPTASSRLFRIPLNIETSGLVSTTYKAQPAHLALRLQLGRTRIANAQSLTFDADAKPNIEAVPLDAGALEIELNDKTLSDAEASAGAARKLRK
ncbi:type VI secretion system lipoprotein TssJ [Castellaniella sp. S9]|uniref:type VI secretion system lipoprotein TssJ n=1 Tax=Castellaniella sp. S9 TaxID=2993652 RepID=UPI0022B394DD|nr:type VI secretion system lipoprotein TssJ [Castellaniella sp. S9]